MYDDEQHETEPASDWAPEGDAAGAEEDTADTDTTELDAAPAGADADAGKPAAAGADDAAAGAAATGSDVPAGRHRGWHRGGGSWHGAGRAAIAVGVLLGGVGIFLAGLSHVIDDHHGDHFRGGDVRRVQFDGGRGQRGFGGPGGGFDQGGPGR